MQQLEIGKIYNGKVKGITQYGAFVDIDGGGTGMVHISELSWARIKNPAEVVAVGDVIGTAGGFISATVHSPVSGKVFGLDEILNKSVNGSGYNENYGLLGSNKATEDSVKLFPRDSQVVVDKIALEGDKPSTKVMAGMFKALGFEKTYTKTYKTITVEDGNTVYGTATREAVKSQSALVVLNGTQDANAAVILSCNNIPNVKTTQSTTLNVYDILNAEKLVMTVDAVKKLEEVYA